MKTNSITASTSARHNGWAAVLEYPNGGRQLFTSRHGSMGSAQREADKLLRVRLTENPAYLIPDPDANCLQIVAEINQPAA